MDINGAIDGDAAQPEEDASIVAGEGLDALQCCAEGILEDLFSELGNGKTREDGLAVELVCEPLEEDASGLSVALTNSGDDVSLVLYGGQIAGVVASQGCLLSSPQTTREEHQSYTKVWQTRPCR